MSMSDPIADMLTRARNAQKAKKATFACAYSKMKASILDVMKEEGYIKGYTVKDIRKGIKEIVVELKYFAQEPVIKQIKRISKPGRRVYSDVSSIPRYYSGLGVTILSTPKGIMSDAAAREAHVGGEIICSIF